MISCDRSDIFYLNFIKFTEEIILYAHMIIDKYKK